VTTRVADLACFLTAAATAVALAMSVQPRPSAPATRCFSALGATAAVKPGVPLHHAQELIESLAGRTGADAPARFQPINERWGPEEDRGEPVSLTYSFVPDGTMVDGLAFGGFTEFHPSVLHARLNALFGDEQTWKQHFRDMFDDWAEVTGNTYTEVPEDGAGWFFDGPFHGGEGRGDIRIGMAPVTPSTFFAFNEFPEDGNMVLDSNWPWGRLGGDFPEWRNTLAHEHGHGLGLAHTCPQDGTKLMEPTINANFVGPQLDDVLSAQFHYGDRLEPNDDAVTAVDLPLTGAGAPLTIQGLSLHSETDADLFRIPSDGTATLSVAATPIGAPYPQGPQTSACDAGTDFDPARQADLVVELRRPNGAPAAIADSGGLGDPEGLTDVALDTQGDWRLAVTAGGANPTVQAYTLTVSLLAEQPNPADLNADGCVDSDDLGALLAAWGAPAADLTGDGVTDSADLGVLLAAWSEGC